jgi:hypothetical protein
MKIGRASMARHNQQRAIQRVVKMLRSVEGVYRQGKIELLESPPADLEGKVIVTFLSNGSVDLAKLDIDEHQAADLRQRLKAFAADWDQPEMDVYDAI